MNTILKNELDAKYILIREKKEDPSMKKKNLLISASLALGVGVGVFAGIGLHNGVAEVNEVKAATEETTIYIDARATHWFSSWSASNANLGVKLFTGDDKVYLWNEDSTMSEITVKGVTYLSFDRSSYLDKTTGLVYAYNDKTAQNCSANFTFEGASAGQNLLTLSGGTDTSGPSFVWGTLEIGETCDVTKHAVYNGVLDDESPLGTDPLEKGESYAVPARINRTGYHFGGWFTDVACTEAYTARVINADLDIYAKYTTLSKDSYIYYITDSSSATPNMIHTWGGDVEYTNNDVSITGIAGVSEVHGVMRFRNTNYLIYKIPFSSESGDTGFNFHYNNWETESVAKTLVAGNAYQWGNGGIATDEEAGGDALDFLLEFEGIRNAVVAAGDIKSTSICGISSSNVAKLCKDYNGLSETARGYVDASYTYTYKGDNPAVNDNVTFYDMMEELASRPGGVALVGHSGAKIASNGIANHSETAIFAAAAAASIALLGTAGFFLLRRKKEN